MTSKEERQMKNLCDEVFKNHCFICKQEMEHITGLTWFCKRCDMITKIENTISFKGEKKTTIRYF